MPDLKHALNSFDLGHLRIIAELWGMEIKIFNRTEAIKQLIPFLLNPINIKQMVNALPNDAQSALKEIYNQDGFLGWSSFTHQYGSIREVGAGRRDLDKIYLSPVSPAEALWFCGFIARDFFDTETGPQEYVYIPQELLSQLPFMKTPLNSFFGRPAMPTEYQVISTADDSILDHACTLLSCLRTGMTAERIYSIEASWPAAMERIDLSRPLTIPLACLRDLLSTAGSIGADNQPVAEITRDFLAIPRNQALAFLFHKWRQSQSFNELKSLPGVTSEGDWQNNPLQTRNEILKMIQCLPQNVWWNLPAFINDIKQKNPNFQRPSGDYDSWFIRDTHSGKFLRGFESWERVEGALLSFFVTGLLHWLGIVHLGQASATAPITAFRITDWAAHLLEGKPPLGFASEDQIIYVKSNAEIHIPRLAPRSVRYLIARFCEWTAEKRQIYHYRITPQSLDHARRQGLTTDQFLTLLKKNSQGIPPQLIKALQRWEAKGSQARIESVTLLKLKSPDLLRRLRQSRAARFLGDPISATVIALKPGSEQKVLDTLAELGYLGEILE